MTIEESHIKFKSRIGLYNGFLFQTESHFKEILSNSNEFSNSINLPDFNRPILSSNLVYRNPITVKYEFAYQHSVDDKNIKDILDNLKTNYCNFVIAQCFEAFETFIKDISASFLSSNLIPDDKIYSSLSGSTFEECRKKINEFCTSKNKYNKKVFSLIYSLNSKVSEIESDNFLRFDFKEWNIVFTEIRHAIVHSNGQFDLSKSKDWTEFQKELLNQLFLSNTENNVGFICTVSDYAYIIRIIAQHGQIIYDSLKNKNENDR